MRTISEKKTVIVLAGTRWQIPLVKKLKEKECRVIVFNSLPDSPAFQYADEYRIVDILDYETCLKIAEEYAPDAFMSDECDIAVPAISYLSKRTGLISIGADMAELYTNKYRMRLFGKEHAFDTPLFYKCDSLEEAINAYRSFARKMIMKPMDANSSRGVFSVECEEDIAKYFENTLSFSKVEKSILLEEYIDGTEFTVDGIKTEVGHVSLVISEKKHYTYNENIARSLYFSYTNDKFDYDRLRRINDRFVELSGLPFGLTHAEYKYREGRFYLIEIGARGGGNLISASIVPLLTGVETYDYLIDKTLGRTCTENVIVSDKYLERCAVLNFFDLDCSAGIVREIRGEEYLIKNRNIVEYAIYCKVGDKVVNAIDDSTRIGFYIAYGENRQELENIIRETEQAFRIILE